MVPDSSDLTPDGKETPGGRPAPMYSSASTKGEARKGKTLGLGFSIAPPRPARRRRGPTACLRPEGVVRLSMRARKRGKCGTRDGGHMSSVLWKYSCACLYSKQHIYWKLFVPLVVFEGTHHNVIICAPLGI